MDKTIPEAVQKMLDDARHDTLCAAYGQGLLTYDQFTSALTAAQQGGEEVCPRCGAPCNISPDGYECAYAPPSAPVGVGERQALANVPFGWVKDAPSGIRSTLDFTTLPGVAEGWRVEGYRVVTLYSLPYLRQQPSAVDEAGGDDA